VRQWVDRGSVCSASRPIHCTACQAKSSHQPISPISQHPPTHLPPHPLNPRAPQATVSTGGASFAQDTPVSFNAVTFQSNSALVNGGAVYLAFKSNYNRVEAALSAKGCPFRQNVISAASCSGPVGGAVSVQQEGTLSEVKLSLQGSKFDANRAPAADCQGSAVVTSRTVEAAPKLTVTLTGVQVYRCALPVCLLGLCGCGCACRCGCGSGCGGSVGSCSAAAAINTPLFLPSRLISCYTPSLSTRRQLPTAGSCLWQIVRHHDQPLDHRPAAPRTADSHLRCHLSEQLQQLLRCGRKRGLISVNLH